MNRLESLGLASQISLRALDNGVLSLLYGDIDRRGLSLSSAGQYTEWPNT